MKTTVPENLKADLPPTKWGKVLSATPVIMTVVATLLAGLSSSEMTRAQYDRSLAAQLQSKAGDQWSFFQAKKLRGALQASTLDMIASTSEVRPLDAVALRQALSDAPVDPATLTVISGGAWPETNSGRPQEPGVHAAVAALEASRPDAELNELLAKVDDAVLETAVRDAKARALAFDAALKPANDAIGVLEKASHPAAADPALRRNLTAARLAYQARRYDAEARVNQTIGTLYELQVRKSNISADRHNRRSQQFFFGMAAAQMGVIVSTLAMAARRRNLLWSLAAAAGATAVAFAVYVYLYV